MRDGTEIDISEMSDSHLANTIKLVCTRYKDNSDKFITALSPYCHEVLRRHIINTEYVKEKNKRLRDLENELNEIVYKFYF